MIRLPPASPGCRRLCLALLSGLVLLWTLLAVSQAQITLDGSLGARGPVTGPNYRIGAELGQTRGSNLFHSFEQFNVPTGGSATFTGPNTIANIVSRVTGGQPSAIDGLLRSEIARANLFLLNPSGVLFGSNAALDVSGSFHVSTADFLRFTDRATFFASLGQESVLTMAPPAAFGFLASTPAAIAVQGSVLAVPTDRVLSVVGRDITLAGGTLQAASGRIQLASVASPGVVPLELAPDLQVEGFARLGQIALSQRANVTVSSPAGGAVSSRPGAGTRAHPGGRLLVDNALVNADTTGTAAGARLGIDVRLAEDLDLRNGGQLRVASSGAGSAGEIALQVRRLTVTGGGQLISSTLGTGRGGTVRVTATDAIAIAGHNSGLFSMT